MEDGLDDVHVGDSILDGGGDGCIQQDGFREEVALEGVLVGGFGEHFPGLAGPVVQQAAGLIRRGVEGDLDLDPAAGAHDQDALVALAEGRTGEGGGSVFEDQHGGSQHIGAEFGVELCQSGDPPGLSPKDKARERDGVAADIQQAPAADAGYVADVMRIVVVVGEKSLDGTQFADSAGLDLLAGVDPLGVEAVHESLHDFEVGVFPGGF